MESKRIHRLTEDFVRNGYVVISGVSAERKRFLWNTTLSPALQLFWSKRHADFEIDDPKTWPCPLGGKAYGDTLTEEVAGLPALLSENYEAQAILVYFCAGRSMMGMTFGAQTHWRLKLLVNPLWALGLTCPRMGIRLGGESSEESEEACHLQGKEQSWHLVNWPAGEEEGIVGGAAVQGGAHIDSGTYCT